MKSSQRPKPAFQTATLFAGVVLLLIVFVSAGYFFTIPAQPSAPDISDERRLLLEKSIAKWAKLSKTDLSYVVERDCYCAPDYREPYLVTVRGQDITFSYVRAAADSARRAAQPPEPLTVEDLFGLVDRAIDSAESVSVLYNAEFGYPETLTIDWSTRIADEDQRFIVRDVRATHHNGASL
jgi:hypothetical protein